MKYRLSCDDCAVEAKRSAEAGGKLHLEKLPIGEYGFISLIYDTEDNMIGLHSMKWKRLEDVVAIPGTKRRIYLEENAAALEIELTAGDLAELSQAAPVGSTAGAHYPESSMAAVNRWASSENNAFRPPAFTPNGTRPRKRMVTKRVRTDKLHTIGLMASPHWYCKTSERFEMIRPIEACRDEKECNPCAVPTMHDHDLQTVRLPCADKGRRIRMR